MFSKKDAPQTWSKLTGEQPCQKAICKATLQLHWNDTQAWMGNQKFAAHPQNTLLRENASGEVPLYINRDLKYLHYKNFLFTVVQKILTQKTMAIIIIIIIMMMMMMIIIMIIIISRRAGNTVLMSCRGWSHLMRRGILFSLGWQSF